MLNLLRTGCLAVCLAAASAAPVQAQIFMSPEEAKELGQKEHPKVIQEFGGVYEDPNIGAYVAGIAGRLASVSGQPATSFTFTVLNSPIVNAFALPGGFVYITRGTLALANNEAEAAGVLGHEIGHVIARHSEQRYDRSLITQGAVGLGSILGSIFLGSGAGQAIGQIGSLTGSAYLASFSRENEFESDLIGVRLLAQVGYAPDAQAAFLQSLSDYSDLATKMAGQAGKDRTMDMFSTHPRGPDRVRAAIEEARAWPQDPIYRRDEYLDRIDGMLYGDDPKEGVVRGTTFTHPDLRLSFSVPQDWRISNTPAAVIASHASGQLQFDMERDKRKVQSVGGQPLQYLTRVWLPNLRFQNAESIKINGMPAATASARVQTKSGSTVDARFVAVQFPNGEMVRFTIIAPSGGLQRIEADMIRSVNTLKYLSEQEAAAIKPLRLRVVPVKPGDTSESVAAKLPFARYKLEQFRVLNGLREGEEIKPGERIKIVE